MMDSVDVKIVVSTYGTYYYEQCRKRSVWNEPRSPREDEDEVASDIKEAFRRRLRLNKKQRPLIIIMTIREPSIPASILTVI